MKIVGMIRYSLPAGFAAKRFDENFDVFGEPYFSQRLNLFKSITLQSLAGQTDKDFQVIVYHSDAILENKKKIFDDLEKSYSFLKNVYQHTSRMDIVPDKPNEKLLTFRIDNDDGLPVDFIKRLRKAAENVDETALSVPRIRKLAHIGKNQFQTVISDYPSNSIGLAYVSSKNENIMNCGNHRLVQDNFPTKMIEGVGGLQVIHGSNVANGFNKPKDKEQSLQILSEREMKELLVSEGYPDMDIENIPLFNPNNQD